MLTSKVSYFDNITVMMISGRIDSINAPHLRQRVFDEANNPACTCFILDMQGVHYMSAAGLRILRQLQAVKGAVHIAAPSNRVREILQISGLDAVYKVYFTQAEALKHCPSTP